MEILRPWWQTPLTIENGEPSNLIVVFAPTIRRFRNWCEGHGVNYRSRNVMHGYTERDIRGLACYWYVWLGTDNRGLASWHRLNILETTAFARELGT